VNRVGDTTPITTSGGILYVNNSPAANTRYAETIGTVIDPSGLTVISLVSIDPSSLRRNQMRTSQSGSPGDSEVKDIKLILPDNTEIASE
jgi:hypothetical protein